MRCIVHLDMDCFYAQVEAVRQGIDCRTAPYALVQWGNFIAVNYPARALGVTRFHDSPEDAVRKYPTLQTSHIATYRMGATTIEYPPQPRISTHKVALEPYREASRRIFDIINGVKGTIVEKAGVDEAYVDATEAATAELDALRAQAGGADLRPEDVRDESTKMIEDRSEEISAWLVERGTSMEAVYDGPMRDLKRGKVTAGGGSHSFAVQSQITSEEEEEYARNCLLLCAATRVVRRIRDRIYTELHYDCSAGIAHNRVLAKCISATHKPNQQTLLLPDRAASALFDLPLSRLRGFGGKFGAAVSEVCGGVKDCRDAWLVSFSQFASLKGLYHEMPEEDNPEDGLLKESVRSRGCTCPFGGTDALVFYSIRGWGSDDIKPPRVPTSLTSSKVFYSPVSSESELRAWTVVLAAEICHRSKDYAYVLDGVELTMSLRLHTTQQGSRACKREKPLGDEGLDPYRVAALATEEIPFLLRDLCERDGIPYTSSGEQPVGPSWHPLPPLRYAELVIAGLKRKGDVPICGGRQLTLTSLFQAHAAKPVEERECTAAATEHRPCVDHSSDADEVVSSAEEAPSTGPSNMESDTRKTQRPTIMEMLTRATLKRKKERGGGNSDTPEVVILSDSQED